VRQKVKPSFVAGAGITVARARSFTPVCSLFLFSLFFFLSFLRHLSSLYNSPFLSFFLYLSPSSLPTRPPRSSSDSCRLLPTRFIYVVLVVLVLILSPLSLPFCSFSASSLLPPSFSFSLIPHPFLPSYALSFLPSSFYPYFLSFSLSLSLSFFLFFCHSSFALLLQRLHQP